MGSTAPTRIDAELYASAEDAGSLMNRSAAQQLAHWARIGREIEASASISQRSIAATLAGRLSYDQLTPHEQAVVRAEWDEQMDARREDLDVVADFAAAGTPYLGLDAHGHVVRYGPDGIALEIGASAVAER